MNCLLFILLLLAFTPNSHSFSAKAPRATLGSTTRSSSQSSGVRASGKNWSSATSDKTSCLPRRLTRQISSMGRYFKKQVRVVSAHRSASDNARRGGASGSTHKSCKAVDFTIPGVSNARIRGYLDALYRTGRWGIGYYCNNRFHLDVGNKRVWGNCYSRAIKNLIPRHKRAQARYQSNFVSNSAVGKTTKKHSGVKYGRMPTSESVD